MSLSICRSAHPKTGEALLQSGGYAHLIQTGEATDLPTMSDSPIWQKASQFQQSVETAFGYLLPGRRVTNQISGLASHDESSSTDSKKPTPSAYLAAQQLLSGRIPENIHMIENLLSGLGKPLDDRKLQLEDIVGWLATSGRKGNDHGPDKLVNAAQGQFITLLWNDLSHPPTVDLNPQHKFRTPDGRYNNLTGLPFLGAANQAYARSVKPVHPTIAHSYIAEPEDMFDAILRRPDGVQGFKPHPAKISSLLFGFANIIIHDLFWSNGGPEVPGPTSEIISTDQDNTKSSTTTSSNSAQWQNLTSSYLSLDPLYGVSQKEQDTVRDQGQLGRGLLYNDTFASKRLLLMPPASCALLVLFSRNHNRIARQVLELNERGNWKKDLSEMSTDELRRQDDEIFGTARHVNCGFYVGTILHDYLQAILNTVQVDSDWTLDPRIPIKSILGNTPKAIGNTVTVEFNSLYRWHAPISWTQTQWIENNIAKVLPSRRWEDLNGQLLAQSANILKKTLNAEDGSEPRNWKISKYEVKFPTQQQGGSPELQGEGAYERDSETGKFRDEDIASILKNSTQEVAGTFGARHVPAVLRWIECQGMRTSRNVWKTCTLNEFRAFLGLKEFDTFEEWNSDKSVASAMEDLVGHPSNIPLHVGLHGEEAKTPRLGAGLCPNYTNSRAILSDAVSLVRGDRFYTDAATADTMTDWGFRECQSDVENGAYGGMIEKLIRKNLPNQYAFNDCALLFPFLVPEQAYSYMRGISLQKALNYSVQSPPQPTIGFKHFSSGDRTLIYEISDTPKVKVERMRLLFGLPDMKSNIGMVYEALKCMISKQDAEKYKTFFRNRIQECSVRRSPVSNDKTVDVTRDVTNPLISGWLAHIFGLVETGIHTQQLLLCALSDVYCYINESPQISFASRRAARVAATGLIWQIEYHIKASASADSLAGLIKKRASILAVGALNALENTVKTFSGQRSVKHVHAVTKAFYHALKVQNDAQKIPLSTSELAADCLRAVSTLAYTIVNGTAHALDYLMPASAGKPDDLPQLRNTLQSLMDNYGSERREEVGESILKHALEAVRLGHWVPELRGMIVTPGNQKRQKDEPIGMIDNKFRIDREFSEYLRLLDVEEDCLPIFTNILPTMIHEVFLLNKVRRAPGRQGELTKISITGAVASIPTMHIRYDGVGMTGRGENSQVG